MAKKDYEMVREYSERLLGIKPESTAALEGLAAWASATDDVALTAKFCTLLVAAVPDHFEGWFNLGLAHQKSGHRKQAADAYTEAIRVRPQASQAYTNLGIVRQEMGDTKGAKEAYEQAFKLNANATAALWNLSLLLEGTGEAEEAERAYSTILQKTPDADEARFRLGYVKLQREDWRGSAEVFQNCLERRPKWPEAQMNLALAYWKMGDYKRAQAVYEQVLSTDPKSLDALRGLAALSLERSDIDQALEYHARLVDLGERTPELLYNTGLLYQKSGQLDEAAQAVSRCAIGESGVSGGSAESGPRAEVDGPGAGSQDLLVEGAGGAAGAGAGVFRDREIGTWGGRVRGLLPDLDGHFRIGVDAHVRVARQGAYVKSPGAVHFAHVDPVGQQGLHPVHPALRSFDRQRRRRDLEFRRRLAETHLHRNAPLLAMLEDKPHSRRDHANQLQGPRQMHVGGANGVGSLAGHGVRHVQHHRGAISGEVPQLSGRAAHLQFHVLHYVRADFQTFRQVFELDRHRDERGKLRLVGHRDPQQHRDQ